MQYSTLWWAEYPSSSGGYWKLIQLDWNKEKTVVKKTWQNRQGKTKYTYSTYSGDADASTPSSFVARSKKTWQKKQGKTKYTHSGHVGASTPSSRVARSKKTWQKTQGKTKYMKVTKRPSAAGKKGKGKR